MAKILLEKRKFKDSPFGICDNPETNKKVVAWKDGLRRQDPEDPTYYLREIQYKKHREKLSNMRADPQIALGNRKYQRAGIVNEINYHRQLENVAAIDIENARSLIRLRNVYAEDRKKDFYLKDSKVFLSQEKTYEKVNDMFQISQQNIDFHHRLNAVKSTVDSVDALHEWYTDQERKMATLSKFPLHWKKPCKYELIRKPKNDKPNPLVYMDFEVQSNTTTKIGRIFIELFARIVPKTAENFRQLCINESYVGLNLAYILEGIFWQGGNGADSYYGGYFPDENYQVKHDSPGIISMVNFWEGKNKSEFRIMAVPFRKIDSRCVAFGKVILGMPFLHQLTKLCEPNALGIVRKVATIIGSGETTLGSMDNLPPVKSIAEQNAEYNKAIKSKVGKKIKKFMYIKTAAETSSSEDDEAKSEMSQNSPLQFSCNSTSPPQSSLRTALKYSSGGETKSDSTRKSSNKSVRFEGLDEVEHPTRSSVSVKIKAKSSRRKSKTRSISPTSTQEGSNGPNTSNKLEATQGSAKTPVREPTIIRRPVYFTDVYKNFPKKKVPETKSKI